MVISEEWKGVGVVGRRSRENCQGLILGDASISGWERKRRQWR